MTAETRNGLLQEANETKDDTEGRDNAILQR